MFIIWIALYFLAGGIVSTLFNVVLDIDDVLHLALITAFWPVGFAILVIGTLMVIMGYIPKHLGEAIKKIMKTKRRY